jgi:putative N-acetylmannosamine-6-phosphate epimerase
MCKLIVSIQGYSIHTTNELADIALSWGSDLIRTDRNIGMPEKTIGLVKNFKYKNYITPTIQDLDNVNLYANYIAVDCRRSNLFLKELLYYADIKDYNIICDIETLEDLKEIPDFYKIKYVSSTFDFNNKNKLKRLKEITDYAKKRNIQVIAEGGYSDYNEIIEAKKIGVDYICIGQAISEIGKLTEKYKGYLQ